MLAILMKCVADEAGVTVIEYGLITVIILIAVVALIDGIGASVSTMLGSVSTGL
jgi:Flp pilus assembly pilin Flp